MAWVWSKCIICGYIMSKQRTALTSKFLFVLACLGLILGLVACGDGSENDGDPPTAVSSEASETPIPEGAAVDGTPVATAVPSLPAPTATVEPMAALVNGRGITLQAYEQELARYEEAQLALGGQAEPGASYRAVVLNALIEQAIIEEAAANLGIEVTDEMVAERVAELTAVAGGEENFASWLAANQWDVPTFSASLRSEMLTERVVATITADVPYSLEQVRARYIRVDNLALAQQITRELEAGSDFGTQAQLHSIDPTTADSGGDLGFFARGSLLVSELETAAFALNMDEMSDIISAVTSTGETHYFIVQLLERDDARPLSSQQRARLLQDEFEMWLAAQLAQAQIQTFVDG